jgi:hypothetical protein
MWNGSLDEISSTNQMQPLDCEKRRQMTLQKSIVNLEKCKITAEEPQESGDAI